MNVVAVVLRGGSLRAARTVYAVCFVCNYLPAGGGAWQIRNSLCRFGRPQNGSGAVAKRSFFVARVTQGLHRLYSAKRSGRSRTKHGWLLKNSLKPGLYVPSRAIGIIFHLGLQTWSGTERLSGVEGSRGHSVG